MGTQKFHALEHISGMLKRLGAVEFAHAGSYKTAHENFKHDYRNSSRRRRVVMDEIVAKQNTRLAQQKMLSTEQTAQKM